MSDRFFNRRALLGGITATGLAAPLQRAGSAGRDGPGAGTWSVRDFGVVGVPGHDNTSAIQKAIDFVQSQGGGTLRFPESYECGNLVVSGSGVTLDGPGVWLTNARITATETCERLHIEGLGLLDNRGDDRTYLLDISGRHCTFNKMSLVKDPIAGGYQMYLRKPSAFCTFTNLQLRGSNGIFISGHDHKFSDFLLLNTMARDVGGDDAFVLKAPDGQTYNIDIRNGRVVGYAAILSIGSEVGSSKRPPLSTSFVRDVTVSNVVAEKCTRLAFIKPGALVYDWRNGLVENIMLSDIRLEDPMGVMFTNGVLISAARGAIVRGITGRRLSIQARARDQGLLPTSAIDLNIIDQGSPARIENVDIELAFVDPHHGAPHGPSTPGYPVDHAVRIEKINPAIGAMEGIDLDVTASGTRFGGVYVGAGLDGAVRIRRGRLRRIGMAPPSSLGGGGIWSDSRITLQDVEVEQATGRKLGGRGLPPEN